MKNIKEIADKIVRLEKEYNKTHNSALESEIMKITNNLSLTDLLELDDFILNNYNLKK